MTCKHPPRFVPRRVFLSFGLVIFCRKSRYFQITPLTNRKKCAFILTKKHPKLNIYLGKALERV